MKICIISGSDLRYYGGGEKDLIRWASKLNTKFELTIFSIKDKNPNNWRVSKEFVEDKLRGVKIVWYRGRKLKLLKDILPLQKIDVRNYDKVYSMCQGFLLNRKLVRQSKRFLLGIHTQSTLMKHPVEVRKLWKRVFFRVLYSINMHYIKKADEIRIQNKDDKRRLKEIGFKGKIWNVPPSMFDVTPEPLEPEEFYVIWINRVSPEKRPENLVEIANMLPKIQFHAVGSGSMEYVFNDSPNIKKMGFLSEEKLSLELQKASVCVLTSRGETFGMSGVEAQAYGVPTISYDVMGLRDYNEVRETTNQICLRILDYYHEFIYDKKEYMEKRKFLREKILEQFSDDVVIPQIADMLR